MNKTFTVSAEWMKACGYGEEARTFPVVRAREFASAGKGFQNFYTIELKPGQLWQVAECRGYTGLGELYWDEACGVWRTQAEQDAMAKAWDELERPGGVGAMRISPEQFARLARVVKLAQGATMRERWDALFASGCPINALYAAGLNDDHIDTALRAISRMANTGNVSDALAELERPGGCGAGRLAVYWTAKSSNKKTGPIPVSTTSAETCPSACPLAKGGCYAKGGNVGILWHALTREGPNASWKHGVAMARSTDWRGLCKAVAALPEGTLWRHNQAGDLPHTFQMISDTLLEKLVAANHGKRGFTYTHHDVTGKLGAHNRALVRWANAQGFTINLSADSLAHADKLSDMGCGPVVVVLPAETRENCETPAGHKVVVCPAVIREDVTCKSCGLCARPERRAIVGFPAHGSGAAAATRIAEGKCL